MDGFSKYSFLQQDKKKHTPRELSDQQGTSKERKKEDIDAIFKGMTEAQYKKAIRSMFDYLDADQDGYLTLFEFKQVPKLQLHAERRGQVDVCRSPQEVEADLYELYLANQEMDASGFQ